MKISEVCDKTGLTKRTIRFYEEKGLIAPESEDKNGKSFREYSDDDVRMLNAVSTLRRLDFSIDEISQMIEKPESIGKTVLAHRSALWEKLSGKREIIDILSRVNGAEDIYALSDMANGEALSHLPLKDIEPDFSKFEALTYEEKNQAYEKFHNEQLGRLFVSKRLGFAKSLCFKWLKRALLLGAVVLLAAVGISFIPERVDIKKNGSMGLSHLPEESYFAETITVRGWVFTPLLFEDFFVGDVTFENHSELNIHAEPLIQPEIPILHTLCEVLINADNTVGDINHSIYYTYNEDGAVKSEAEDEILDISISVNRRGSPQTGDRQVQIKYDKEKDSLTAFSTEVLSDKRFPYDCEFYDFYSR